MINGRTELIAHLGYPTETFTAPMIYNPWFASRGINAVVVPMGARAEDYEAFLRPLFRLSNIRGALVTMPHKVATVDLLDEAALAVQVAGSCNAILRRPDGSLYGDLFDGIGFVRGAKRKGFDFTGADCLIVGAGGVGSAIAAAIAAEGPGSIALFDIHAAAAQRLAARLRRHFPSLTVGLRDNDPAGYRLVVNATPLGMSAGDPLAVRPDAPRKRRFCRGRGADRRAVAAAQGCGATRLPLPGRNRHAVRTDTGISRILRLWHRNPRGAARGLPNFILRAAARWSCRKCPQVSSAVGRRFPPFAAVTG